MHLEDWGIDRRKARFLTLASCWGKAFRSWPQLEMDIRGTRALVTGASKGIGKAIAEALVAQGAIVWGTSRNPENCDWSKGIKPLRLDLSSLASIEAAWNSQSMESLEFDIVVNNAGSGAFGRFDEFDFDVWENQIGVLLTGPMRLSRLALPGLRKRNGYLVNVSSLAVEFSIPFMSAYNAAKAGLSAFSESLVIESVGSELKVIDFQLGDFKTDFNYSVVKKISKNEIGVCADAVWGRIKRRISVSPTPDAAADKLLRCIQWEKRGVIRAGTMFQVHLAPFFSRLVSRKFLRAINISYYVN